MIQPLFSIVRMIKSYIIENQNIVCPDSLVASVLEYMEANRKVFLPDGSSWKEALTRELRNGGQTIECKVTIDTFTIFCKKRIYIQNKLNGSR